MKWCEHALWNDQVKMYFMGQTPNAPKVPGTWVCCPMCGTPRPPKTPLRELLAQKLHEEYLQPVYEDGKTVYYRMADEAIKVIKEYEK